MNRADGERLLLALKASSATGAGVRFVVYLADGTPAFAGAGLCVQVSDQGRAVPPEQRYETLLDTLQFDERSRPVYDYIVAVRSAAYQVQQQAQGDAAEGAAYASAASEHPGSFSGEDDATSIVSAPVSVPAPGPEQTAWSEPASEQQGLSIPARSDSIPAFDTEAARAPSFLPPPIPTGLLTRPARTTHWQPAPPRRPTPRPSTGLFRYAAGALPRPARPPRPELDPAFSVAPAPRP